MSSSEAAAADDRGGNRQRSSSSSSSAAAAAGAGAASPYDTEVSSPWNQTGSPFAKSPWSIHAMAGGSNNPFKDDSLVLAAPTELVGSLVREEGHIYSLAACKELLYTGSESKNIRVWKKQEEFTAFKSNSGLVKAIVIARDRIFTGHQDGKIRVWKTSSKNPKAHRRSGSLPTLRDYLRSSLKPSNYVEVRRKRNVLWIKHHDAVSCLALSEDMTLIYSGSWDKTFKVWRIADSKCLESVTAHDDAVNSVVVGFDGVVFSGSADGTIKVWRREAGPRGTTKHAMTQTLLKQECAVTALAVGVASSILYCGSSDGLVNFWEHGKNLSHGGVLRGHKLAVLCLAAAGNLVLSGSADKTICVWRKEAGAHSCLSVLDGHTGPVKCLAVEADQDSSSAKDSRWIVYSGSLDKSVKVWRVSELAHDLMLQHQQQFSSSSASSIVVVPDQLGAASDK